MTLYISPYQRMAQMRDTINRLFEESIRESPPAKREMLLAVDVQASEEAFDITALVPGLEADDINIEILNNTVSLRGEFKSTENENVKYLTCELPAGRFARVITLPTTLDPSKAEATIKNGVLHLHIPKAEVHRPKSIKVNVG